MSKTEDGGSAFPPNPGSQHQGMSLRDYFAGQALAGFAAAGKNVVVNGQAVTHDVAAYMLADGMLTTRGAQEVGEK